MNLEQRFTVALPVPVVWAAFHDPQLLVGCLPGAALTGPERDGALPLLFRVKLGPIAAAFAGSGTLALDEAARAGSFAGQAADGKSNSRVKGEARFQLAEDGPGTQVSVAVDFAITGSLAQFSREGIVRALADQLTRQFADNLQHQLSAGRGETQAPQDAAAVAPQADAAMRPPAGSGAAAAGASSTASASDAATAGGAFPPVPRTPTTAGEAPALNLLTLVGALLRQAWQRLLGRKEA